MDGRALAPASAPTRVKRVIEAANRIVEKPYRYGGGHRPFGRRLDTGYDCSGSVSYALYGGRFLRSPLPSGSLMNWAQQGHGQVDHRVRARQPRLRGGGRPPFRHLDAGSRRARSRHRAALEQEPPPLRRIRARVTRAATSSRERPLSLRSPPCSALAQPRSPRSLALAASAGACPPRTRPRPGLSASRLSTPSPTCARGAGSWTHAAGRSCCSGVNVNALAEYWKGSRFRTVFPLARKDPRPHGGDRLEHRAAARVLVADRAAARRL